MNTGRETTEKRQANNATVVACLVFHTKEPEQLVELLRDALAGIAGPSLAAPAASPVSTAYRSCEDPWLKHLDAAQYLGISISTLYRYACQHLIESRKLGGRLEYLQSTLDRFKDRQIRPARRYPEPRRIITEALGSGK
jgi:hypothetical protein